MTTLLLSSLPRPVITTLVQVLPRHIFCFSSVNLRCIDTRNHDGDPFFTILAARNNEAPIFRHAETVFENRHVSTFPAAPNFSSGSYAAGPSHQYPLQYTQ